MVQKTVTKVTGFKHVLSNAVSGYRLFDRGDSSLLWAAPVSKSSYRIESSLEMLAPCWTELLAIVNIDG